MKTCPKCNTNCLDDQKICDSCGFELIKETTEPEVVNEESISFQSEEVKRRNTCIQGKPDRSCL